MKQQQSLRYYSMQVLPMMKSGVNDLRPRETGQGKKTNECQAIENLADTTVISWLLLIYILKTGRLGFYKIVLCLQRERI